MTLRAPVSGPLPWGTAILVAGNVMVFLLAGPSAGYPAGPDGTSRDVPSIGQLVADGFRHPGAMLLVITISVLGPAAVAVERWASPVGLVSCYVVGAFCAGFAEVAVSPGGLGVVGAFGGTTTVVAMWAAARWRGALPALAVAGAGAGWLWVYAMLGDGGVPWLGAGFACALGLFASKSEIDLSWIDRRVGQ